MANLTFPSNPTNGQKITLGDKVFVYSNTTSRWTATKLNVFGNLTDDFTIPTPVVTLSANGQTLNSLSNNYITYSVDQDVKVTIDNQTTNATAVHYTSNNTIKIDPSLNELTSGTIRISADNGRKIGYANYVFSVDNQAPFISLANTFYDVSIGAASFDVVVTGTDPENQPLTYSASVTGGYANAISSITQSANVFTITVASDSGDQGNAVVTFTVDDGVETKSANVDFYVSAISWTFDVDNGDVAYNSVNYNSSSTQSSQWTNRDLFIKPDGTKLYTLEESSTSVYVREHSLSTAFDISSASAGSYTNVKKWSDSTSTTAYDSFDFAHDGSALFVTIANNGKTYKLDMSTAWDLSTLSYNNQYFSHTWGDGRGFKFFDNGNKLYTHSYYSAGVIHRLFYYTLSTPYNLNTLTSGGTVNIPNTEMNSGVGSMSSMAINTSGTRFWFSGNMYPRLYQMDFTTPYVPSTTNLTYIGFTRKFTISPDGTKIYGANDSNATVTVNEYDVSVS